MTVTRTLRNVCQEKTGGKRKALGNLPLSLQLGLGVKKGTKVLIKKRNRKIIARELELLMESFFSFKRGWAVVSAKSGLGRGGQGAVLPAKAKKNTSWTGSGKRDLHTRPETCL